MTVQRANHADEPIPEAGRYPPGRRKRACWLAVEAPLEAQQTGKAQQNGLIERDERCNRQRRLHPLKKEMMRATGVIHNARTLS
jgi:hypothetical protein